MRTLVSVELRPVTGSPNAAPSRSARTSPTSAGASAPRKTVIGAVNMSSCLRPEAKQVRVAIRQSPHLGARLRALLREGVELRSHLEEDPPLVRVPHGALDPHDG